MAIDPLTGLAFALQSQPGVYAVLLGSGVSRAAQIPTGWVITTELIRRLAAAEGATIPADPVDWYQSTFGKPVGFSDLLAALAPSRSDRRAILSGFIDPSLARPDERRPTAAHRALARLACTGRVRVFLTTNFDRLLEQALSEAGLNPLVITNPAQAAGAPPFQHIDAVVFKLHGDYLDPDSMLVTEDELVAYDPPTADRLSRALEDHGLVVCGWSGDWDPALRNALMSTTARRYPLYFATVGAPSTAAAAVITARSGIQVPIADADTFFTQLESRVVAIDRLGEPHPLDTQALVAGVKTAVGRPDKRVDLEDLVVGAANSVYDSIRDDAAFPATAASGDDIGFARQFMEQAHRYDAAALPLVAALVAGVTWGSTADEALWARAVDRVANTNRAYGGQEALLNLRRLPALLCVYAVGLAAVDRDNFGALRAVTTDVEFRSINRRVPLLGALHPGRVLDDELGAQGLALEVETGNTPTDDDLEALRTRRRGRKFTPTSNVLHAWLREPLRATIPDDVRYTEAFDRLEMVLALVAADVETQTAEYTDGPAFGGFTWRYPYDPTPPEQRLKADFDAAGAAWPPLVGGLLGGSAERAAVAFDALIKGAAEARRSQH